MLAAAVNVLPYASLLDSKYLRPTLIKGLFKPVHFARYKHACSKTVIPLPRLEGTDIGRCDAEHE
eukprot:7139670-Lingulodinium_polyedra.AAC.1